MRYSVRNSKKLYLLIWKSLNYQKHYSYSSLSLKHWILIHLTQSMKHLIQRNYKIKRTYFKVNEIAYS